MANKVFDKKSTGANISNAAIKSDIISNQQLVHELNQLLEKLKNVRCTFLLKIKFEVQI